MTKISVIVPVYKVEPYLRRCVDSILAQTYRDFELILVDDGSPDNCGKICDEYARQDSRVVVIHQENAGLSAARNAGLDWMEKNSGSQWVSFIDSDDWVAPTYLEKLMGDAISADVAVSICGYIRVSGAEERLKADTSGECHVMTPEEFWIKGWEQSNVAWCKLYSRRIFQGVRYPIGRINEDAFVTYRVLFALKKVSYRLSSLYFHWVRPDSIMGAAWTVRRFDDVDAIDSQIDFFKSNGFEVAWKYAAYGQVRGMAREAVVLRGSNGANSVYWKEYRRRICHNLATRSRGVRFRIAENRNLYAVLYPRLIYLLWPTARCLDVMMRYGIVGVVKRVLRRRRDA